MGTSAVQAWCERFDRKAGDYDGAVYREELKSNTDFRKYDGVLRAVIDVTPRQADAIEAYLEEALCVRPADLRHTPGRTAR